jgi:DNA polymerase III epsilon subunit-like protein
VAIKQRFAILDLEASGTFPNRITEIGIVFLEDDGKEMVIRETYSTLINPECIVGNDILNLTGLTQEELDEAPCFYEKADDLLLLLKNCILVAHHIDADFKLLSDELEKLGHSLQIKTLCTYQLAKKAYPSFPKYDLKTLCGLFSIPLPFQHRALDDAFAACQLFMRCYFNRRSIPDMVESEVYQTYRAHPSLASLPEIQSMPGILYCWKKDRVIFIKFSYNVQREIFKALLEFKSAYKEELERVQIDYFDDSLLALQIFEKRLNQLNPLINRKIQNWAVIVVQRKGRSFLEVVPFSKRIKKMVFFHRQKSKAKAWVKNILAQLPEKPNRYSDEARLWPKQCEKRLQEILNSYNSYPTAHFVVGKEQKGTGLYSCHFFTNEHLLGHAELSKSEFEELQVLPEKIRPIKETPFLKFQILKMLRNRKSENVKTYQFRFLPRPKSARNVPYDYR